MGVALLSGSRLTGYTLDTWVQLLLLALVPQILGHSSLNWALKHLSATYVSLSVLAEPIGSTLLAWWILRERPTWSAVVGGMVILVGLFLATRRPRPPAGAPPM
jgi:drug/metabolite transporter (DMT)-like permease